MRVLIIGGTGFIGPDVVACLGDMGHEVAVFHRGRTQADLPGKVKHFLGDRRHLVDSAPEFRCFAPDVVLDMFPLSEQDARMVMGTLKGLAGRVVAISSQDVYRAYGRLQGIEPGPVEPVPLAEDAPLRRKLYPYRGPRPRSQEDPRHRLDDYEKILVERAVMGDPGLPGTVLRLPMVYGPRDPQHRLFEYLKRMDDNRPAIFLGEGMAGWRWSRGYVTNIAAAIALAVADERARDRIYNVGEAQPWSMAEWVEKIGQTAGWKGRVVSVAADRLPAHLVADINTDQHMVADTSRIREELGYKELVPQGEALRWSVAWQQAHPPAEVDPGAFEYAAEDALLAELDWHGG